MFYDIQKYKYKNSEKKIISLVSSSNNIIKQEIISHNKLSKHLT